jgi:hypothetical protein
MDFQVQGYQALEREVTRRSWHQARRSDIGSSESGENCFMCQSAHLALQDYTYYIYCIYAGRVTRVKKQKHWANISTSPFTNLSSKLRGFIVTKGGKKEVNRDQSEAKPRIACERYADTITVAPPNDTHCHQGHRLFRPPRSHKYRPKENIDPEVSVVKTKRTEISTMMCENNTKTESMSGSSSLRRRRRLLK